MKKFLVATTLIAIIFAPLFSFAQTQPPTELTVEQRLEKLEKRMCKAEKKINVVAADAKKKIKIVRLDLDTFKSNTDSLFSDVNNQLLYLDGTDKDLSRQMKLNKDTTSMFKKDFETRLEGKAGKNQMAGLWASVLAAIGLAIIALLWLAVRKRSERPIEDEHQQ